MVARPVPSNPRRLEVTWQTPSTWPDPESFPLKFFLRYRPLIQDQWQHVSAPPLPRSQGLYPHWHRPSVKPEGSQRGCLRGGVIRGAWGDGWS